MIRIMAAVGRDRLGRRGVMLAVVMVIVVVMILGAFLFGVDRVVIEPFFKLIGILPKTSAG